MGYVGEGLPFPGADARLRWSGHRGRAGAEEVVGVITPEGDRVSRFRQGGDEFLRLDLGGGALPPLQSLNGRPKLGRVPAPLDFGNGTQEIVGRAVAAAGQVKVGTEARRAARKWAGTVPLTSRTKRNRLGGNPCRPGGQQQA